MGEDEGTEDAVDDNEGSEANMGEEMGAENLDAVLGLNSSIALVIIFNLCWGVQANNTNLGKCTSFLFFIFNRYAFSAIRISIKMTHFSDNAKQKCF